MMGTSLQVLMRLQTTRPSRSGRPRSSTITSGACSAAWLIPSCPVSAVRTVWPRACSPTLQTLSRPGSSSMMRICGNLQLLRHQSGHAGLVGNGRCHGQREAESRAAAGRILDPYALPVRLDKCLGDGQAQPGARVAGPSCEQLKDLIAALGVDPGTVVSHVRHDRLRVREDAADRDRAVLWAMPDGVFPQVGDYAA